MKLCNVSFEKLKNRTNALCLDLGIQKKDALIYLLLVQRFLRSIDEFRESLVDGGNDCGIDAVFIEYKHEQPIIHLIQSKFHDSTRKAEGPFKAASLEKIIRFFEILKGDQLQLPKLVNPALEQKILEIRDLQNTTFPQFKIWMISNGNPCVGHDIAPLASKLQALDVDISEFHLLDFVEFCINQHSSRQQHVFHVKDAGIIESGDTELYSIVGYISAKELYNVLKDLRDERKMDYSLFDMNVRGFLGMESPINKQIFKSASSRDNSQFSSLNNGITIIGTDVNVMKMSHVPKIGVRRMSIVNGAQTCSAIFDCMKDQYPDFSKFEKLSILFRLFKTDDPEVIDRIALSTNSQNRIHPRDLRANDNYQHDLSIKLRTCGIHYIRKRGGSIGDIPPEGRTLDALKAGQLLLAYVHRDPAAAKKQSDYIFNEWYGRIFGAVDISKLVRAFDLYSKIEQKQQYIQDEMRIRGSYRVDNTFVTYGGFHILTLCGVLAEIDPKKSDEELIDSSIDVISHVLANVGAPAYYTFFRNPEMTKRLIEQCSQPNLFGALIIPKPSNLLFDCTESAASEESSTSRKMS